MRKLPYVPWRATLMVALVCSFAFGCSGGAEGRVDEDVLVDVGPDAESDVADPDTVEPDTVDPDVVDPDTGDDTCEGGNRPDLENACGGCEALDATPGDDCGTCGGGTWVCDGEDALICEGAAELNACGGCEVLEQTPGEPCGPCGIDAWICDGENAVLCNGSTSENECGGCAPLDGAVGDACGPCTDGALACEGEALTCSGSSPAATCAQLGAVRFGAISGAPSDATTRVQLNAAPTTTLRTGNDAVQLTPAPAEVTE